MTTVVYTMEELKLVQSYRIQRRDPHKTPVEKDTIIHKEILIHSAAFGRYEKLAACRTDESRRKLFVEMFGEADLQYLPQGVWRLPPFSQPPDMSKASASDDNLPTVGPETQAPWTAPHKHTHQEPRSAPVAPWVRDTKPEETEDAYATAMAAADRLFERAEPAEAPKPKRKAPAAPAGAFGAASAPAGAFKAPPAGAFGKK